MNKRIVAAIVACLSLGALAQGKPCSKAEAGRAEKAVDRVGNFAQMQKAYKDYAHCDTGPVSDLFTETFVRLLVDWKDVDGAVASTKDADFKAFMDKHLKDPTARDDLDTIYSRAKTKCPSKHEAFCAELAEFVKAAGK